MTACNQNKCQVCKSSLGGSNPGTVSRVKLAILEGVNSYNGGIRKTGYRRYYVPPELIAGYVLGLGQATPGTPETPGGIIGIDPGTIVVVGATVIKLFSSFFAKEKYQDLYNVWAAAASALPALVSAAQYEQVATYNAVIAVLGVDYMNKPWGANWCDSAGKCGNAAHWAEAQPTVENKAKAAAPFFYFLEQGGLKAPIDMESLYAQYKDFKNQGPLYQQYAAAMKKGSSGLTTAGFGGSQWFLIAALITAGVMVYKNKKKF